MIPNSKSDGLHLPRSIGFFLTAMAGATIGSPCLSQTTPSADGSANTPPAISSPSNTTSKTNVNPQSGAGSDDADDAVVFVRPLSAEGANIGIAYSKRVAHAAVRADVNRLAALGQWQVTGPVQISDESVHPDQPAKFAPTTGVFFRATHAPQITGNAPNLLPYLKAFQRFHRFELVFEAGPLQPYRGVTRVENSVLNIQMSQDEGLYSFQITVHNHKENIPALVNSGAAIDHTLAANSDAASIGASSHGAGQGSMGEMQGGGKLNVRPPNMLLVVTLALGAGTLVGGSIYLFMSRQSYR